MAVGIIHGIPGSLSMYIVLEKERGRRDSGWCWAGKPDENHRAMTRQRYAVSVGAFRIGLLLASIFLLLHLFIEPRPEPRFHPVVDTALVTGACAVLGYLAGLLLWQLRGKRTHGRR